MASAARIKTSATISKQRAKPARAAKRSKAAKPTRAVTPAHGRATPGTSAKATTPARAATPRKYTTPRADLGKPIDSFFDKQPPQLREILIALRALVENAAPDATSSIKWGMPFYEIGGRMFVALGAHKAHVNLILSGPPGAFKDPSGRLTGEGKTGRHLKLTKLSELPRDDVKGWVKTAAHLARTHA